MLAILGELSAYEPDVVEERRFFETRLVTVLIIVDLTICFYNISIDVLICPKRTTPFRHDTLLLIIHIRLLSVP